MKIIAVIVDEMPLGAYYCEFVYKNTFQPKADTVETFCKITGDSGVQKYVDSQVQRCPACPLRLEPDTKEHE